MFKNLLLKSLWILLLLSFQNAFSCADVSLPTPLKKSEMRVFEALQNRSSNSGGDFSISDMTLEQLSDILWAASGLNRGTKGWTVPSINGLSPYVRIYLANNDGAFIYNWSDHSLKEISKQNIKSKIGLQSFVRRVPQVLIFVMDLNHLSSFDKEQAREFGHVQVGAMTQNVYLAAAALRLGARYIHSINKEEIVKALSLTENQEPVCIMLLGK